MNLTMLRADVKPERADEAETATKELFAAIDAAQPKGVHYASCRVPGEPTFVVLVGFDDPNDNPLPNIPEWVAFQQRLKDWIVQPPTPETVTVVGSYGLF